MALTDKLSAIGDAIRSQSGKTAKLTLDQMPGEIIDLQSLAFEVVGGTSAPSNPKENTVWVNTDVPIGAWYFSATQPENMAEGDVWFSVGTSSPAKFNALKKNGIQVYPLKAQQYISGAWVNKTAKSYQGGAWVDWVLYLYNAGNECTGITGGWREGYSSSEEGAFQLGTMTKNAATIKLQASSGGYLICAASATKINVTDFNTLKINVTARSVGTDRHINFCLATDSLWNQPVTLEITSTGTKSIDVSSLSGYYHVIVECYTDHSSTSSASVTFDKIWLE